MPKTVFLIAIFLIVGFLAYGFVTYLAERTDMQPLRERTQKLCESTGGIFMNCNKAFSVLCGAPMAFDGTPYVCACVEGTRWDVQKGCSQ